MPPLMGKYFLRSLTSRMMSSVPGAAGALVDVTSTVVFVEAIYLSSPSVPVPAMRSSRTAAVSLAASAVALS